MIAHVSKMCLPARVTGVRIPSSPLKRFVKLTDLFLFTAELFYVYNYYVIVFKSDFSGTV